MEEILQWSVKIFQNGVKGVYGEVEHSFARRIAIGVGVNDEKRAALGRDAPPEWLVCYHPGSNKGRAYDVQMVCPLPKARNGLE